MEKITKIKRTIEITECIAVCKNCGKRIVGSTEGQVTYNLLRHKEGKECKNGNK